MDELDPKAIPDGKVWVHIHGLYGDDLFEVDASTPALEIADARAKYKAENPNNCVFISCTRITQEKGKFNADEVHRN